MSFFLSSSRQTGHFPIYSWDSTIRIGLYLVFSVEKSIGI
jgi:hypothetical protein